MSVRSGQSVTKRFTTRAFSTGAATDATGTPTGILYVNGTADAASVTVTNTATGKYKAAVTLPTLAAGDFVELEITATVSGVTDSATIWDDTKDMALDSSFRPGIDWSNVGAPTTVLALTNTTVGTATTVTSQLTAAQIATGLWQDTTAGDFTVATSPGKIIFTQLGGAFTTTSSSVYSTAALANAPTGGTAPTTAQIATAVWTDLLAGSDFSTAASVGKLLKDDVDAAVSSRMATYTQPTGFLAATFPTTVASTTNITAGTITTTTNLTNAPPDSAGVTTLLARLGAFTGSGINTVLGFFRAMFRAESPAPSDVGGTYDPLTASLEALHQSFAATATASNQTTILARLGPFSGTSTNNVFGFLEAVMRDDVGTPTDMTGANYDPGFDSLEAISGAAGGGLDAAGVRAAVGLGAANLDAQLAGLGADVGAISPPTTAQIADKLLGRNVKGGSDGGRTVYMALAGGVNKVVDNGNGTFTVYDTDDTTILFAGTLTRSTTVGPVTGVDPS